MPARFGSNVEVFHRDERTGRQTLVQTSFKKLPPCAACGQPLAGNVEKVGGRLVHAHHAKLGRG